MCGGALLYLLEAVRRLYGVVLGDVCLTVCCLGCLWCCWALVWVYETPLIVCDEEHYNVLKGSKYIEHIHSFT